MILCNKLTLSVPQKNQWLSHGSHLHFLKQPSMTAIRLVQILAIAVCALLSFKLQTVGPRLASSEMLEICFITRASLQVVVTLPTTIVLDHCKKHK
jgi:hypothetical protein